MRFENLTSLAWIDKFLGEHTSSDVFVVGGAVRDMLLDSELKDIDLVITGLEGEKLEQWLSANGRVNFVGKRFGVWKFSPFHNPNNPEIDIALPRKEISTGNAGAYTDFSIESDPNLSIEDDLSRRDFTVNAMAYSWREKTVIDPFGGAHDLKSRTIRAVGDASTRLSEDSSRMLRALRFAVTLRATVEPTTMSAIKKLAHRLNALQDRARVVSKEIIGSEFQKAFFCDPSRTLGLYQQSGVWNELFPGLLQTPSHHLFEETRSVAFDQLFGSVRDSVLVVLLCFSMFPNRMEALRWVREWHIVSGASLNELRVLLKASYTKPGEYSLAGIEKHFLDNYESLVQLFFVLNRVHKMPIAKEWTDKLITVMRGTHGALDERMPPLVTGEDLLEHQLESGPLFATLLDQIRTEQIEGKIKTKEEALELLHLLLKKYDDAWV